MKPYLVLKRCIMALWYRHVRLLTTLWPSITVDGKTLTILPGVYKPLESEQACATYCNEGDRVLDLGCGSGVCTVFAAATAREVVAADISPVAVRNTALNCERLGVANPTVVQSDMFANVQSRFDLILSNAPYIAADFDDAEAQFATSVRYLPTLFAKAHDYLEPDGRLLIQFPRWFARRIETLARAHDLEIVSIRRMPPKSLRLHLLSLAYLHVGFRSSHFLLRRCRPAAPASVSRAAAA